MNIPFSPPTIENDDIEEVVNTLRSGWITTGPKTKCFEREISAYCGTDNTVCLNSATAALELTLRILGVTKGDEVITSAYTYTASASVVCHLGATLKLVDCRKEDFLIDYNALSDAITEKTKAIIPVDIAGVPCDYDKIFEIVNAKKSMFSPKTDLQKAIGRVAVVADGAHSLGSVYKGKKAASYPDFCTFSFHAVKNLTTAEGGAVTWCNIDGYDNSEIYKNYQLMSLHGQNKDALTKTKAGAWEYDITEPLYKCNMTDISAALGLSQLKKYDRYLAVRESIFEKYNAAFKDFPQLVLPTFKNSEYVSSKHLYLLRFCENPPEYRNAFIEKMSELGVACNVHYKPLPMLTAYKNLGFDIKNFPVAYNNFINEISLPVFNSMTAEQSDYVAECVIKVLKETAE